MISIRQKISQIACLLSSCILSSLSNRADIYELVNPFAQVEALNAFRTFKQNTLDNASLPG